MVDTILDKVVREGHSEVTVEQALGNVWKDREGSHMALAEHLIEH